MWTAIRVLRHFDKSLGRIATALEAITALYQLDLASRGLILPVKGTEDRTEISYSSSEID